MAFLRGLASNSLPFGATMAAEPATQNPNGIKAISPGLRAARYPGLEDQ